MCIRMSCGERALPELSEAVQAAAAAAKAKAAADAAAAAAAAAAAEAAAARAAAPTPPLPEEQANVVGEEAPAAKAHPPPEQQANEAVDGNAQAQQNPEQQGPDLDMAEQQTVAGSQEVPAAAETSESEEAKVLARKLSMFEEGMIVLTSAKRNKDKLDGKTARVIKVLTKSVKVFFLEGPVVDLESGSARELELRPKSGFLRLVA